MATTPCATVPLVDFLDDIEDPRVERARLHSLHDILVTTIRAVICGAGSWTDMELFGRSKHDWLATFLDLPHGIPSHDTYGRVFALLDPEALERGFSCWVQSLVSQLPGEVVAIDGKTARRSHDRWLGVPALHVVSAWAAEAQLVLGQRKTDAQSNEITAISQLLALLELQGCIVTIDRVPPGWGCQTAIAEDLRARGADYVLSLKRNQPHMHAAVVEMFAHEQSEAFDSCFHTFTETVGKGHGRIETRRCWAIDAPDYRQYVDPDCSWPGLRSLVMVEAERCLEDRTTTEIRYFISSLPARDARLPRAVRRHWGIENSLHLVLDIAFREDESRIRTGHAAHNMALLRCLALNLLRRDRQAQGGLAARRKRAGWDHRYLRELLTPQNAIALVRLGSTNTTVVNMGCGGRVRRQPPTVFIQPKTSSTRLRIRRLTASCVRRWPSASSSVRHAG